MVIRSGKAGRDRKPRKPVRIFESREWFNHLTNATPPQAYLDAGAIGGVAPQVRWVAEELMANWHCYEERKHADAGVNLYLGH